MRCASSGELFRNHWLHFPSVFAPGTYARLLLLTYTPVAFARHAVAVILYSVSKSCNVPVYLDVCLVFLVVLFLYVRHVGLLVAFTSLSQFSSRVLSFELHATAASEGLNVRSCSRYV